MPEDRPAIILANIRRIARDAQRRGVKLDPARLLAVIGGGKA